jgi:hypothetical protein
MSQTSVAGARQPAAAVPRPAAVFHLVVLALCSTALLLALALSVRGQSQVVLPGLQLPLPELCMLRRTAGLDCPGCGLTRCFISLAHGDFASAWSYNPAGLLLFVMVALQVPFRAYQLWRIRLGQPELSLGRITPVVFAALALALFAQWVARMSGVQF